MNDVPVTIKDVARELGVAHSTVSRAIHNDPRISAETRSRVLAMAEKMGYRPNAAARGLVCRRMQAIGLVIPAVADSFFGQITDGVDRVTYDAGFSLSLYVTHGELRRELDVLSRLSERRVDGLILMVRRLPRKLLLSLAEQPIPIVFVEPQVVGLGFDCVRVDNRDGERQAVRHLLELGHRRIAFISGPKDSRESRERLAGYREALLTAGVTPDPQLVLPGEYTEAAGAAAAQRVLEMPAEQRPTALVAFNDRIAIGAMSALQQAGLEIPRDMSLVGYDDILPATYVRPQLTTVHQPIEEMGAAAARLLIDRLSRRRGPRANRNGQEVLLRAALVQRQSTAPPGADRLGGFVGQGQGEEVIHSIS
ncbi:MAG: LacI family DNA-binding transcriptional regulator [Limnochordaceae bacterium]|nr:LacI family DNA-binding transcriptional regulator [Limnochordaceae bacterium]